jgi:hypothetical protein
MTATSTNDHHVPRCVAIVAMGPSREDYLADCLARSGRFQVADETWAINAMAGVIDHDRAFIMDDPAYFSRAAREHRNLEGYKDWLHRHPGPVYTSRADKDFPGTVDYPLQAVLQSVGFAYFNSTPAYALALAIHWNVPEVKLYGMDYTQGTAVAEAGRACLEYWIAIASERGMKVRLADHSSLCDHATGRPLYGYARQPKITWNENRCTVEQA